MNGSAQPLPFAHPPNAFVPHEATLLLRSHALRRMACALHHETVEVAEGGAFTLRLGYPTTTLGVSFM
jgi:hypothetical protein